MAYTPGPWTAKSGANSHVFEDRVLDETGKCVAFIDSTSKEGRLILAAPKLLAALQAASDHLVYCGYGDEWERGCARDEGLPTKIATALAECGE